MTGAHGSGYRLLDAGDGRRLEAFGERVLDRPARTADGPRRQPAAWARPDLQFVRDVGWIGASAAREPWTVALDALVLELRPTASGQVGLFPEHLQSLPWLRQQVARAGPFPRVLNLFAHTGLATLALASAGATVVHVDGAKSAVAWARRNAALSGLDGRPVHWIVDDATAFVAREVRRARQYDGFVLDPPAYGHGAGGPAWQLEDGLSALLRGCAALARTERSFCLLTGHSGGQEMTWQAGLLATAFRRDPREVATGPMELRAASGARLPLGSYARLAA